MTIGLRRLQRPAATGLWTKRHLESGYAELASESIVPVDRDWATAAPGGVMRKCLHLSIITEMSAGSLTRFAHFFLRPRPECLVGRRKNEERSQPSKAQHEF